jgi:hypothetical protein
MGLPKSAPPRFTSSRQLIPGDAVNGISDQLYSTQALTATTVQTQAGAVANALINAAAVAVTTANSNDAVALPPGYAGLEIFIANLSAVTLGVFTTGTDTIDATAAGTALGQTASKNAVYKCVVGPTATTVAKWYRNLSA